MQQADFPTSEIQGIKIGDQFLPVKMYERDGKKVMQIVLPDQSNKDGPLYLKPEVNTELQTDLSAVADLQNSFGDNSGQFTVDNFIDNLNLSNSGSSIQGIPIQSVAISENELSFLPSAQCYHAPSPSTSDFSTQGFYPSEQLGSQPYQIGPVAGTSIDSQNFHTEFPIEFESSKMDPELINALQSTVAVPEEDSTTSIGEMTAHISTAETISHVQPAQDIVAAAFEESVFLQAPSTVSNTLKTYYEAKNIKQRRKLFDRKVDASAKRKGQLLYVCNYGNCRMKFCNKIGLDIHLYTHTGLKPVTCKVCEKSFLSSKLFDKHKCKFSRPMQEMKGVRYECDICLKNFGNIGTLFIHKRSHKGSKPYTCGLCTKAFTLKSSMYKHVKSHGTDVRYKCQTCEKMFRSPWHLEEHLMSHVNEKKLYNCSQCEKVFTNYSNYIGHVKSHSIKGTNSRSQERSRTTSSSKPIGGLKCNVCLKTFTTVVRFQQHLELHGPKKYQCTECKRKFVSKDYLQNHLQWYISKHALGQSVHGHERLVEKFMEKNQLNIDEFLNMVEEAESDIPNASPSPEDESLTRSPSSYLCDMCGNYFATERALTRHIKFHNNIPYQCRHCDKKFSFLANLQRHELTHKKPMEFDCYICNKVFDDQHQVDQHIQEMHSGFKCFTCNICNKKFSQISNLRRHKQLHSADKNFPCSECNRKFVCSRYLKEHTVNVHASVGKRKQECPYCHIVLSGNSNLNRHLNLHYGITDQNKKLECEVCKKRFEFNSDLEIHMRSHTGEKPFECEKCSKCFMSMSNLRRHLTTHNDSKDHVCEICGKSFKIERYLIDHRKIHLNPVKVTCDICNLSFSSNTNMKRHKLIHSGEKPFSCEICNKNFRSKGDVDRHRAIHSKGKSEQCHICSQKFKHKELLRRHLEKHERGIPTCGVCGKQFPTNYKLQRHQQTHQDNFLCNICNTTFRTSHQLEKHVETHDILEMRSLIIGMGSMKQEKTNPVKTETSKTAKGKQIGTKSVKKEHSVVCTSSSKKTELPKTKTVTTFPIVASISSPGSTSVITVSQVPISTLSNVISIKDFSQINTSE